MRIFSDDALTIKEFVDGFARVAKIVTAVDNYNEILGKEKIDQNLYRQVKILADAGGFNEALTLLCDAAEKKILRYYVIPDEFKVIFYGMTNNNQRELVFFRSLMRFAPSLAIYELNTESSVIFHTKIEPQIRLALLEVLKHYKFSLALVRQLNLYLGAFLSFSATIQNTKSAISGLVVANDHSPNQVALSKVCKLARIKRVYLQHAEVTKNFPVLDFDYALLHNKKSKNTYLEIGKTDCKIGVFPRGDEFDIVEWRSRIEILMASRSVVVVIYPSSVFKEDYLIEMVRALNDNKAVSQLGVKFHPQYKKNIPEEIPVLPGIPNREHVAITGNSSVALELVARGNLVYLDSSLDDIQSDYYGFVKEGFCGKLCASDYGLERFWVDRAPILDQQGIKERFSADETGHGLILKQIYSDFATSAESVVSMEERCLKSIILYPATFFSIAAKSNPFNMDDFGLIKVYESLFLKRVLPISQCYKYFDYKNCSSITEFWFLTKQIEWNGFDCGEKGLDRLEKYISTLSHSDRKLIGWVEGKFFDIIIRLGSSVRMDGFLKGAKTLKLAKLAINKKIAFLRYIDHCGADGDTLRKFYDCSQDESLTNIDKLKIAIQCNRRDLLVENNLKSYLEVEGFYLKSVGENLRNEYEKEVQPFFRNNLDSIRFIDAKYNERQKMELLALIERNLLNEIPFSLLRLSDGEGYFFVSDTKSRRFTTADARNRERHWWGEELSPTLRARIVKAGLESVRSADVLGVPTIYRFLRDTSSRTTTFGAGLQGRGLLSVLNGLLEFQFGEISIADDKVNTALFTDRACVRRLSAIAKKTIFVSGALSQELKGLADPDANVEFIEVPTHNKQVGNMKFNTDSKPLPYHFEKVYDQIIDSVGPGSLVLVGAGVAGKSFIHAAKIAGGCGIDVGSALDELAGAGIHSLH